MERKRGSSRLMGAIATLVIVAAVLALEPTAFGQEASSASDASVAPVPPNIIFILTDDQRWDTLSQMPNVQHLLVDHGVTFENAFVSNALCCPSRSSILTGLYSHSTGVYRNAPPDGAFQGFQPWETSTVPFRLDRTYETALVGKYLNGYARETGGTYVPPGWDRWISYGDSDGSYYDYALNIEGRKIESHAAAPADYSPMVLAAHAVEVIHETKDPLFLYFAPFAPHRPATPATGDAGAHEEFAPSRPPSFNEADVSDKPAWLQEESPLSEHQVAIADGMLRDQLDTLLSIDRAVGDLVEAVRREGELANTMFIFTSDNGYLGGEHRLHGKQAPYEESIRVPLVVRYDRLTGGEASTDDHLVVNVDFALTELQAAGAFDDPAAPVPPSDGMSFLPLVAGQDVPWREDFLIEHRGEAERELPSYCGVRTERYKFVQWVSGETELYDLQKDPYELENVTTDHAYAREQHDLERRLRELCWPTPW